MDRETIFEGVRECLAECIRVDPAAVRPDSTIIDELGADSLDLLDIVFALERRFKVKIRQGDIERRARENIPPEAFERDNRLLPAGAARMREILPEIPAEKIPDGLSLSRIPYLFTVETFVRIIGRALDEKAGKSA